MKTLARSFAGGVIGPELFGRLDLSKFQTGLAKALNWQVLPHGPVQNRPGFGYILEAKDSTAAVRVISFSYNTEQTFILEFGDQYVRFHTNGGTLLETGLTITGISQASPGVLTYTGTDPSNGDWMFLSGIGGMTALNGRYVKVANVNAGANTFELTDIHGGANIDTSGYTAYTAGGTAARVYTVATPYLPADLFDLHYTQSADVLTITHPTYAPRELRRLGATNWQLSIISFVPTIATPGLPSLATGGPGGGTPVVQRYKVTAVATDTLEESLVSEMGLQAVGGGINAITQANPGVITMAAAHGLVVNDRVYVAGVGGMVELVDAFYYVNTIPLATTLTLKDAFGAPIDTTSFSAFTAGGTVSRDYASIDLTVAGNYVDVDPPTVSGAIRYNIYKFSNGLYGYIGQTDGSAFRDNNVTADVSQTPPIASSPFSGAGNYPSAVGYHEQRRCFAAPDSKPQNFWATRSASENNLSYSIPSRDDDAISFRIASREANRIRHIVSVDQLLLLTSGGEWKIAPQNSDVLTPSSAWPKQFSAEGANNVQPVLAANSVIYVQESGNRPRELKYSWEANGFNVRDIAVLAPHLFDGYTLTDMAYSKAPYKTVWFVRSDGELIGLTYLPEQDVLAWHEHSLENGAFESVACVKEGSEYVLYAVVRRTINSRTVRYIERLHTRQFASKEDAFFVDSGLTYDGAAASTITGLWHLEGQTLNVLADGAEHPRVTVSGGAITLEAAASKVHAGLRITADLQTLPLAYESAAAGQGVQKNINEVHLRVKDTQGLLVGPEFVEATMVDMTYRTTEPYGSGPNLVTGVVDLPIQPDWGDDAQLCIRQKAPLPATILSMVLDVATGE